MKLSEMFPRRYATGADLQGKAVALTIARVVQEEMRPNPQARPEKKWVIYFEQAQKGVILSRTLASQIADAIGAEPDDDTSAWAGKRVTLYPVPMQVAGQARIAIRARKANGDTTPPETLQEEAEEDF